MTKGARAMVAAKVRELLKNNKSTTVAAKEAGVAQAYVAQASIVLEYAPELPRLPAHCRNYERKGWLQNIAPATYPVRCKNWFLPPPWPSPWPAAPSPEASASLIRFTVPSNG